MKKTLLKLLIVLSIFYILIFSIREISRDIPDEEYKIISSFYTNLDVNLDSIYCNYFIIVDSTDTSYLITEDIKNNLIKKFGFEIDKSLIEDYNNKCNKRWKLGYFFDFNLEYKFINNTELDTIFSMNDYWHQKTENAMLLKQNKIFSGGWTEFYNRYPDACGYKCFSRVGFNDSRNKAIFFVSGRAGGLAGHGKFIYMEKDNNRWKEKNVYTCWVS